VRELAIVWNALFLIGCAYLTCVCIKTTRQSGDPLGFLIGVMGVCGTLSTLVALL
jgi:hypothetical protein